MKYDDLHTQRFCRAPDAGEDTGGDGDSGGTLLSGGGDADNSQGQQAGQVSGGADQAQAQAQDQATGSQADSGQFDIRQVIGDDGKFSDGWLDKLPENLQEHRKHFEKYQSPIHALEHTRNLQQLLGSKADAVVIPKDPEDKEAWATFREKLGVPESPDGYDLKAPEDLPDGVTWDDNQAKEFASLAHDIGLTPQQVAKLQEYDVGRTTQMHGSAEEQAHAIEAKELADNEAVLKKEWGSGKEFEEKLTLATRAGMTLGFSKEELQSDPIFRNAKVVKMLATAGAGMREDTLASGDEGGPESLKAKANDIINNPQNPEYKKYWDGDQTVGSKVRNWIQSS